LLPFLFLLRTYQAIMPIAPIANIMDPTAIPALAPALKGVGCAVGTGLADADALFVLDELVELSADKPQLPNAV